MISATDTSPARKGACQGARISVKHQKLFKKWSHGASRQPEKNSIGNGFLTGLSYTIGSTHYDLR